MNGPHVSSPATVPSDIKFRMQIMINDGFKKMTCILRRKEGVGFKHMGAAYISYN